MNRAELRRRYRALREGLDEAERRQRSRRAAGYLLRSDLFAAAQTICLYAALPFEADPCDIQAAAIAGGAEVLYPRVEGDNLAFYPATLDELVPGPFGLSEPAPKGRPTPLQAIDLMVVPGLVFDRRGHRLGYGKGYYDRTIRRARELDVDFAAVGFAFELQVVDRLLATERDQPLDALVTDADLSRFVPRTV